LSLFSTTSFSTIVIETTTPAIVAPASMPTIGT
jgi:hypothetical protein